MKEKYLACALLLALLVFPTAARADVLVPGQKPPRNEQSEAFVDLHRDELVGWDSAYNNAFDSVDEVVLWRYPNSGEVTGQVSSEWFGNNVEPAEAFALCYVDEQGRFWGYINYIYGEKMNWVCLSDPSSENLPADPEAAAAVNREAGAISWRENAPAVLLVAGVVVVTGVLLCVFWYQKKKRSRQSAGSL